MEVIRRPRHIFGDWKEKEEKKKENMRFIVGHTYIGTIGTMLFERIKGTRCCLEGIFTHVDSISVSCFHMVGLKRVI